MLVLSVLRQITLRWFNVKQKTSQGVQSARDAIFQGGMIVVCSILIIWVSIFLYTAFYYAYMPSMTYVKPVHLTFDSCKAVKGICSFPTAYVYLTKKQQLFMVGQPYKVNLLLEMPESPANKEVGMFMVCAKLQSRDGVLVKHSCRSTMLHYRSTLLHTLTTLTFSPMMIFGVTEEKQNIVLELFANFVEDQSHPVTLVHVEIQSHHVEFYSATIIINAHLSGLRYLMFHWPILSAIVGISTNLFFIALVCILSYLHFTSEEDNADENFPYEKGEVDDKDAKLDSELSRDASSTEDVSMFEEFPTLLEKDPPSLADPSLEKQSYIQEIPS
ncbi:seipin [Orussus abietinus]|uniref:seipin n=1 Tax=Orussus abietinus TaxID=222816 RepID=UPI00062694D5|nr:seipin [Orussus abietinus]XP_012277967.1 seipin [Orussus abietinus]XP_012277968.1 seipin [Orussus abietinus]